MSRPTTTKKPKDTRTSFRFEEEDWRMLEELSEGLGLTKSEVLRRGIRVAHRKMTEAGKKAEGLRKRVFDE